MFIKQDDCNARQLFRDPTGLLEFSCEITKLTCTLSLVAE